MGLVVKWIVAFSTAAVSAGAAFASPDIHVFSSSGDFVAVDTESGRIEAVWSLENTTDLGGRPNEVLISSAAFNAERGELYVVTTAAYEGVSSSRRLQINTVQLPYVSVLRRREFDPSWPSDEPSLLLDENSDSLYLQWVPEQPQEITIVVLNADDLAEVDRWSQPVTFPLPAWNADFRFSEDSSRIEGPDRTLLLSPHHLHARRHEVSLTQAQRNIARRLYGANSVTMAVDAASDFTLLTIASPDEAITTQTFFVRSSRGSSGPLITTARGTGRLSPDGARLILREIDGPATGVAASQIQATGRVAIYDVETGRQIFDARDERLAGTLGSTGYICSDISGGFLAWRGTDGRLAFIDTNDRTITTPNIGIRFDAGAFCAITRD